MLELANAKSTRVFFSSFVLILIFFSKPLFDALYFVDATKYLYIALVALFGFISFLGVKLGSVKLERDLSGTVWFFSIAVLIYISFQVRLLFYVGGDWDDLIRKVLPFFVGWILLTLPRTQLIVRYAVVISAAILIFNFISMALPLGWANWGGVHTFKGFYYFKTDLAFTIVMAFIFLFYSRGRVVDRFFFFSAVISAVMVVLSNSRLNYLLLIISFVYCAVCHGVTLRSLVNVFISGSLLGVVLLFLYDPSKALDFDMSNLDRFTQGRNHVWEALLDAGFYRSSIFDIFFGHGLNADWLISFSYGGLDRVHDAHNEFVHLLINQGVFGFLLYFVCWIMLARSFGWSSFTKSAKIFILVLTLIFFTQGMTAVISPYFLKTWWFVLALLLASQDRVSEC